MNLIFIFYNFLINFSYQIFVVSLNTVFLLCFKNKYKDEKYEFILQFKSYF